MAHRKFILPFFLLLFMMLPAYLTGEGVKPDAQDRKIPKFTLQDSGGTKYSPDLAKGNKATVFVFVSFECPVATSYLPILAGMSKSYQEKGVRFIAIDSTDELKPAGLEEKAREYDLPFPIYKDEKGDALRALGAEMTPEVFILDRDFNFCYRGRIDNTFAARLKKNSQVTEHDLQRALDEVLNQKEVTVKVTKAIGCPIQKKRETGKSGTTSFYKDVLPILQEKCQSCHRPNEAGPFALQTYQQAVNWAQDMKEFILDRRMPPWKPAEGLIFHNERRLSDKELQTLVRWVDEGTPEGNRADAPPEKKFVEGWQLGKPDLVLTPSEDVVVGPTGNDHFRVIVLPTGLTEDKYVTAVEVRPGNSRVLHHTLNFYDRSGQARLLEQKEKQRIRKPNEIDGGAGYPVSMGLGFLPKSGDTSGIGGWAPGQVGYWLPEGTGYLLPKGADVVVQLHYHRTGRMEKDRTSIGLYFAKKPVEKLFKSAVIRGDFVFIKSNEERFPVKGTIELQEPMRLHSVMPHMHMLGKEIKVTITPPDAASYSLIGIRDWDYNWQETFFLKEPVSLKAGTRIRVDAIYNNSDSNPNNPFRPSRPVIFGEQTHNEMCFVFLGGTSEDKSNRIRIRRVQGESADEPKKEKP